MNNTPSNQQDFDAFMFEKIPVNGIRQHDYDPKQTSRLVKHKRSKEVSDTDIFGVATAEFRFKALGRFQEQLRQQEFSRLGLLKPRKYGKIFQVMAMEAQPNIS